MISRIRGKLLDVAQDRAQVEVSDGLAYEVLLPRSVARRLMLHKTDGEVTFHTFEYLEGGMGTGNPVPRLVGFLRKMEREFFEKFITVQGIGIKASLKAMDVPVPEIARAIENKDVVALVQLPGVGKRTAEKIVAELHGKVATFALMREEPTRETVETPESLFIDEALEVLLQLQYRKDEAEAVIAKALKEHPEIRDSQELIQAIYKLRITNDK